MAFQVSIQNRYLARNPVIVSLSGDKGVLLTYRIFKLTDADAALYAGQLNLPTTRVDLDLSFVFAEFHEKAGVQEYRLSVEEMNGSSTSHPFLVYGGGISKLFTRRIMGGSVLTGDIFRYKLKNVKANFFLTTRTNSNVIYIPENENSNLYFYSSGMSFKVVAGGNTIQTIRSQETEEDRLSYVSPLIWRSFYAIAPRSMSAVFEIVPEGESLPACAIVLTRAKPTDYFIRFTNSYGVQEIIALYGVIEYTPELEETEDIMRYDGVTGDFVKAARRKRYTSKYTANAGCRTRAERLFLLDMLCSASCEFRSHGTYYAAKVSAEAPLLESTGGEPVDVRLTIELLDRDSAYSPMDFETLELGSPLALTDNLGAALTDNFNNSLI